MKIRKLLKLNQAGFSHIEVGLALVVILVIAAVGVYVGTHNGTHALAPPTSSNSTTNTSAADIPNNVTSKGINTSKGNIVTSNTVLNGAKPCPSGYTCLGSQENGSVYLTYYACLQVKNLSKVGEPNQYTVYGYALASKVVPAADLYSVLMDDFSGPRVDGGAMSGVDRWEAGTNQWLYGVVAGVSHSVSMSEPNHIVMASSSSISGSVWVGGETAGSLDQCPS